MVSSNMDLTPGNNSLDGHYTARVAVKDGIVNVPIVISGHENDLYNACRPENPWFSSLTFERGVPLPGKDYHGAEATLVGYVSHGTRVAFIPQTSDLKVPWFGRIFFHPTFVPYGFVPHGFVPQFPYSKNKLFSTLLEDSLASIFFQTGYNTAWSNCYWNMVNDGVYVDRDSCPPVTQRNIDLIKVRWGTDPLVVQSNGKEVWV